MFKINNSGVYFQVWQYFTTFSSDSVNEFDTYFACWATTCFINLFQKKPLKELWVSGKSALAGGSFYNASVKVFLYTFYAKLPCVCKHDKRGFALCRTLLIFFLFLFNLWMTRERFYSSRTFICLKLTMETLENRKKSVQSWQ